MEFVILAKHQYSYSCCVQGENTPDYAAYLGYMDAHKLYPDAKLWSFESYVQEVVDGKGTRVYEHMADLPGAFSQTKAQTTDTM